MNKSDSKSLYRATNELLAALVPMRAHLDYVSARLPVAEDGDVDPFTSAAFAYQQAEEGYLRALTAIDLRALTAIETLLKEVTS